MSFNDVQQKSLENSKILRNTAPTINTWVRNPSWLPITTPTTSDEKFVGLFALYPDACFVGLSVTTSAGTVTVDWGDGTGTHTYTSGSSINYTFDPTLSTYNGTDASVTFTDSTDLVTRSSHGYTNGMTISFATIVSTTGITVGQIYYVINATTNTFQVSATSGGSAINLVTNGTGTILPYKQTIITVTPTTGGATITDFNLQIKPTTPALLQIFDAPWLDCALSMSGSSTLTLGGVSMYLSSLEQFNVVKTGVTTFGGLFQNCYSLQSVIIGTIGTLTSIGSMFGNCYSLQSVPLFNTASVTNMNGTFINCYSLKSVPLFNTASVTDVSNLFSSCVTLQKIPTFNTSAVITMAGVFTNCYSLQSVPLWNTANVAIMINLFSNCYSLTSIPLLNTASVTSMNAMFTGCQSLISVPLFNTASVTDTSLMFNGCYALQSVPLFNTASVTNMTSMFANCRQLTSVPLFNTASVTTMASMFTSCSSLQTIPLFNTASVTTMASMFASCSSLQTIPLFNTASVTTMASMFAICSSLQTIPLFNTASVTIMASMFASCSSLKTVPALSTAATTGITAYQSMFNVCTSLQTVSLTAASGATSSGGYTNMFGSCPSLSRINTTGFKFTFNVGACKLSASALQSIFTGLGSNVSAQTITITNNFGVDSAVSITGNATAASGNIVTSNTTGVVIGQMLTGSGSGLTAGLAAVSTIASSTIGYSNHGLPNGTIVSFSSLGTTTGITANTPYYVVNTTTNTFQVSLTNGGSAITLGGTASTCVTKFANYVTSFVTNTSITVSPPMVGSVFGVTFTTRVLDSSQALLKGWTVTY